MNKQLRINSESHPQVIVTKIKCLDGEYQIEQGTDQKGEVDLSDRRNDVVSITREQAIKLAKTILEFEGELV